MSWTIKWTEKKKEATCKALEKWLKTHCENYCAGEAIMQDDDCQIYSSDLIAEIVDKILKPKHDTDKKYNF